MFSKREIMRPKGIRKNVKRKISYLFIKNCKNSVVNLTFSQEAITLRT